MHLKRNRKKKFDDFNQRIKDKTKIMKRILLPVFSFVVASAFLSGCTTENETHHYYKCEKASDINVFFQQQKGILISGHRGGNLPGYPENCIETFDKILEYLPTVYEIDPRMTKDSVIVLMHDKTLDRTTTGTGLVREHTFAELQELFLEDRWGNVTEYKIPKVADVVEWSRDKVILNFDIKDVTRDVLVPLVRSLEGVNCMYTVRNPEEALEVYGLDHQARMSAWIRNMDQFRKYEAAGIPWENIPMAYVVTHTMDPENAELYAALRERGVKCMVSTAPKQDKLQTPEERKPAFEKVVASRPDVIETDFPLDFVSQE